MDADKIKNWSFTSDFKAARDSGFNDEEMRQLDLRWQKERDAVLANRIMDVPKDIRERIAWDVLINFFIPYAPPDITPGRSYFILPVRRAVDADEYETLLLSPAPGQWAVVPWQYTSDFIEWLSAEGDVFAAGWIRAMIGEFGLRDDMLCAWSNPAMSGGMFDICSHVAFWRELRIARQKELKSRLVDAAEWVEGMGIPKKMNDDCVIAIPPSETDSDPAKTTFIIPFALVSKNCSLLFIAGRRIPILCTEPFAEIQLRLKGGAVGEQQRWLESLLEE